MLQDVQISVGFLSPTEIVDLFNQGEQHAFKYIIKGALYACRIKTCSTLVWTCQITSDAVRLNFNIRSNNTVQKPPKFNPYVLRKKRKEKKNKSFFQLKELINGFFNATQVIKSGNFISRLQIRDSASLHNLLKQSYNGRISILRSKYFLGCLRKLYILQSSISYISEIPDGKWRNSVIVKYMHLM